MYSAMKLNRMVCHMCVFEKDRFEIPFINDVIVLSMGASVTVLG